MLLLVTTAQPQIEQAREAAGELASHLGRLVQPRHYSSIEVTAAAGVPWAADNDAFNGWDADVEARFLTMLGRLTGLPGCLFVTAPDVVADAAETCRRFERWAPIIHDAGLPVGFVLQDGIQDLGVPWTDLDCVFVGGSTEFKLGEVAAACVREANQRGKWAHMGRVNTMRRVRYAASIGCDSFDGTTFSKWRDRWLLEGIAWAGSGQQMRMGS